MRIGIVMLAVLLPCAVVFAAEIPENAKNSVRNRVDSGQAVGMIIGYTDEAGAEFFGYGSTRRVGGSVPSEDTIFEIGAVTNVFTGLLLSDAVARKEVAYSDFIEQHLPEKVRIPKRVQESVTIEHLVTHRSALPRLPNNFRPGNRNNPYADYTLIKMYEALESARLDGDPGELFGYSIFASGLLGHVLEQASGESYEALIRDRIARPIELDDTTITLSPEQRVRLAGGHYRGAPVPSWDMPTMQAAGALHSTARDLIRFIETQFGLHDILFMDSVLETHRPRVEAHNESNELGLGWFIMTRQDDPLMYWHNGATGGHEAFIGFTLDPPRGVVVLTNSARADIDDIALHLLNDAIPLREEDRPGR